MLTPEDAHYGRSERVIQARMIVLADAKDAHPERFVRQQPVPAVLPGTVWINPPLRSGTDNRGANQCTDLSHIY
jgi:hypothetical protein